MKLITVKLPDDLEKKLSELKGKSSINAVIVEALRDQWFPKIHASDIGDWTAPSGNTYPIYGSIPAEKKQ